VSGKAELGGGGLEIKEKADYIIIRIENKRFVICNKENRSNRIQTKLSV